MAGEPTVLETIGNFARHWGARVGGLPAGGVLSLGSIQELGLGKHIHQLDAVLDPNVFIGLMTVSLAAAALFLVVAQQNISEAETIELNKSTPSKNDEINADVFKKLMKRRQNSNDSNKEATNNEIKQATAEVRADKINELRGNARKLIDACQVYLFGFFAAMVGLILYFGIEGLLDIPEKGSNYSIVGALPIFKAPIENGAGIQGLSSLTFFIWAMVSISFATIRAMNVLRAMVPKPSEADIDASQ